MKVHYVASGGRLLTTALLTLVESVRHPLSATLIWDELPILTKSLGPGQEVIRARTRDADTGKIPTRVPPLFKLVLLVALALTVAAGIGAIVMASIWTQPTEEQRSVLGMMQDTWKTGFGAIIGLLGGKAVR